DALQGDVTAWREAALLVDKSDGHAHALHRLRSQIDTVDGHGRDRERLQQSLLTLGFDADSTDVPGWDEYESRDRGHNERTVATAEALVASVEGEIAAAHTSLVNRVGTPTRIANDDLATLRWVYEALRDATERCAAETHALLTEARGLSA